jgi:serine protease inhibitor
MRKSLRLALAVILIAGVLAGVTPYFINYLTGFPPGPSGGGVIPAGSKEVQLPELKSSVNSFTADLFREVVKDHSKENIALSPFNIYVAMLLLYEGSDSTTRTEIGEVLHLGSNASACNAYRELLHRLPAPGNNVSKLLIANGVWLKAGFPFREEYVTRVSKCYDAYVSHFSDTESAKREVNEWVSRKTEGMIKELFNRIPKDTVALLVSALYFEGLWVKPFTPAGNRTFWTPEGPVKTAFMGVTTQVKAVKGEGYVALELPYRNTSVTMVVIMPEDLRSFTENITSGKLRDVLDGLKNAKPKMIEVMMPKFYVSSRYGEMQKYLESLGVKEAFQPYKADLTRLARVRKGDLYVNKVVHVAAVNVTETGTKAAAATGISVSLTAVPQPTQKISIDHPFIYMLVDRGTDTILFIGQVTDPTET